LVSSCKPDLAGLIRDYEVCNLKYWLTEDNCVVTSVMGGRTASVCLLTELG